jgi:hypothetical protein
MGGFMRWFIGRTGVVAVPLLLAGLAGCGASGGRAAATATTGQQDVVAAVREVIQCLRDNGMPNLPDPQFDSNGQPQFPGGDPGDPPPQAERACKPIYDRLPPSRGDGANRDHPPTDIPALLRFARCMRAHGVPDFPDPKPDGTFPVAGTSLERGKTPEGIRAGQACRQLNPDPQGRIYGSK